MNALSPRPLRVAIDARPLQEGFREHAGRGIGRYAADLVRALGRRDDLALALWFEPGLPLPASGIPERAAVRRYAPLRIPLRNRISSLTTVPWAMRGGDADVFHVLAHGDAPPWLPAHGVVTVHDLILEVMVERYHERPPLKYRVARALEASTLRNARTLIAVSGTTRDDAVRLHGVDRSRVHVVHEGVDERFRPPAPGVVAALRARLGLAKPFVLYVGGIDGRKNVRMLVEAFAYARAHGAAADTELVFAGRIESAPEYPALRELVRAHGLEPVFRPLGFVADADLVPLFAAAEVFAFPSLYEGFGLPPLEAMACGAPVVSSDAGSLAEVLGAAAEIAPPEDPRAFGDALARVLGDAALRERMRADGLAHVAAFTWDRAAEGTVRAYRAAAAAAGRA